MKMNLATSTLFAAVLCLSAASASLADTAVITGKILLKGTPPPEKTIDMAADAACKAMHTAPVTTRHYVVNPDGSLQNVFVYIKEGINKTYDPPKEPVILDQLLCLYQPYVLGVQVNQEMEILNSDDTLHNVHATPKINEGFNKGQPVKGMKFRHKFTKPEVFVRFKCDVHPWMFAYVGVVPHPFYSVSGQEGTFTLKNVPAGKYVIEAIHLKAGTQTQEVTVGDGETKTVDFTFEAK